jgi:hypothetical protein
MLGLQSRILLWYATHACIVARLAWPLSGEGCLRKKRSRPRRKYATIDFEQQSTIPANYCSFDIIDKLQLRGICLEIEVSISLERSGE